MDVTNHDTLYGIVFTGVVSLILGIMTYRSNSKKKNSNGNGSNATDSRDAEITDLKSQRDALQRKVDQKDITIGKQGIEIARLREVIIGLHHNPDGVSMQHPRRPMPHAGN